MVGKFCLFFLLAFAASQTYSAIVEPRGLESYEAKVAFGFWETVQGIIQKIKDGLSSVGSKVANIISKLKSKIEEIVDGLDLDKLVESIIETIKKNIGSEGSTLNKCIDKETENIKQLARETKDATMACVNDAKAGIENITNRATDIWSTGKILITEIKDAAWRCVKDNIQHPTSIYPCFQQAMEDGLITQRLNDLVDKFEQLATDVQEEISNGTAKLETCVVDVGKEAAMKQGLMVIKIKMCMAWS